MVYMVALRNCLDLSKARMLVAAREDDVPIDPPSTRRDLRKRHANLKGHARLLRNHRHRSARLDRLHECIEQLADHRGLAAKMPL